MKKKEKSLESLSIRSYEHIVKRIFLNTLCVAMLVAFVVTPASTNPILRPTFLVLESADTMKSAVTIIEGKGGRVRQRIPPNILIVDLPPLFPVSDAAKTKFIYTSVVPIARLQEFGPMAVAAGLQWNRKYVGQAQLEGGKSLAMARVLMAKASLPQPTNLHAEFDENKIILSWDGISGASVYEITGAFDARFSEEWLTTHSNITSTILPIPLIRDTPLYFRIRAIDHLESEHKADDDVFGSWSNALSVNVPHATEGTMSEPPQLGSPLDGYETEGFTLILEWQGNGSHRVQMSRNRTFDDILVDAVVNGAEFVVPSQALHIGDVLYWRVQKYGGETSDWSNVRNIRIGAPRNTQTDVFIAPQGAE